MATRTSGGKLHLMASIGKISLQETILIEDPSDQQLNPEDDGGSPTNVKFSGQIRPYSKPRISGGD